MDTYSFTTTRDDEYFTRILEEAPEDTNFLIVTERNTVTGEGTDRAVLLVRNRVFGVAFLDSTLILAGATLSEWFTETFIAYHTQENADPNDVFNHWSVATLCTDPKKRDSKIETVRHQIRRINNILYGRTTRVNVESY